MDASGSRRAFLKTALGLAVAAPYLCRFGRTAAAGQSFDPSFGTAAEAARAIRAGVISSRELTEYVFVRIRKHNTSINAFVTLTEEQAMQRAMEADAALAKGNSWGPLHGVPVLM